MQGTCCIYNALESDFEDLFFSREKTKTKTKMVFVSFYKFHGRKTNMGAEDI